MVLLLPKSAMILAIAIQLAEATINCMVAVPATFNIDFKTAPSGTKSFK